MKYYQTFDRDPDSVLDYAIPWGQWLVPGDSIASATWTLSGGIVEAPIETDITEDGLVTIWISGGIVGTHATARCHIITTNGREDDRTIAFRIIER